MVAYTRKKKYILNEIPQYGGAAPRAKITRWQRAKTGLGKYVTKPIKGAAAGTVATIAMPVYAGVSAAKGVVAGTTAAATAIPTMVWGAVKTPGQLVELAHRGYKVSRAKSKVKAALGGHDYDRTIREVSQAQEKLKQLDEQGKALEKKYFNQMKKGSWKQGFTKSKFLSKSNAITAQKQKLQSMINKKSGKYDITNVSGATESNRATSFLEKAKAQLAEKSKTYNEGIQSKLKTKTAKQAGSKDAAQAQKIQLEGIKTSLTSAIAGIDTQIKEAQDAMDNPDPKLSFNEKEALYRGKLKEIKDLEKNKRQKQKELLSTLKLIRGQNLIIAKAEQNIARISSQKKYRTAEQLRESLLRKRERVANTKKAIGQSLYQMTTRPFVRGFRGFQESWKYDRQKVFRPFLSAVAGQKFADTPSGQPTKTTSTILDTKALREMKSTVIGAIPTPLRTLSTALSTITSNPRFRKPSIQLKALEKYEREFETTKTNIDAINAEIKKYQDGNKPIPNEVKARYDVLMRELDILNGYATTVKNNAEIKQYEKQRAKPLQITNEKILELFGNDRNKYFDANGNIKTDLTRDQLNAIQGILAKEFNQEKPGISRSKLDDVYQKVGALRQASIYPDLIKKASEFGTKINKSKTSLDQGLYGIAYARKA